MDLSISELKQIAQHGANALADIAKQRGMTQAALRTAIERASRNAATPIIRGLAANAYRTVATATLVEAGVAATGAGAAATGAGTGAAAAVATGVGLTLGVKVVIVVGLITGIAALGFLAHKEWKHWNQPKPPVVVNNPGQQPVTGQPGAPGATGTNNSGVNQPNALDGSQPNTPAAPILGSKPAGPATTGGNKSGPSAPGGTGHQAPSGNPPGPPVDKFNVENTKGKKLSEALAILSMFDPSFVIVGDTPKPEDEDKLRVVGQDPAGGQWPSRHPVVLRVMLMPLSGKTPEPGAPATAPVPNVVGKSLEEAQPIIIGAKFKPVIQLYKGEEPPAENGEKLLRVISQHPVGSVLEEEPVGRDVILVVTKLERGVVPNVFGIGRTAAEQRIVGSGLTPVVKYVEGFFDPDDPNIEKLRVTVQEPVAGEKAADKSTVTIWLAKSNTPNPPEDKPQDPVVETKPGDPAQEGVRYKVKYGESAAIFIDWKPVHDETANVTLHFIAGNPKELEELKKFGFDKPLHMQANLGQDGDWVIDGKQFMEKIFNAAPNLIIMFAMLSQDPEMQGMFDFKSDKAPNIRVQVDKSWIMCKKPAATIGLTFSTDLTLTVDGKSKSFKNLKSPSLTGQRQDPVQ